MPVNESKSNTPSELVDLPFVLLQICQIWLNRLILYFHQVMVHINPLFESFTFVKTFKPEILSSYLVISLATPSISATASKSDEQLDLLLYY